MPTDKQGSPNRVLQSAESLFEELRCHMFYTGLIFDELPNIN